MADELLEKIRGEYKKFAKNNYYIQDLIAKLNSGKGKLTMKDVDAVTKATGHAIKVAIEKNIAENPAAFADVQTVREVLRGTLGDNYELINSIAANVQKRIDEAQGINLRPQKAKFPTSRVDNLAKFAAEQDLTRPQSVSEVGASVENVNNSFFTDYIKANADFRSGAGLRVTVIRTDDAKCCDWCASLVGRYDYPDVPDDVWRRHKRCSCTIDYLNTRAGVFDRIRYTDSIDPDDRRKLITAKQTRRLTPEQAAELMAKDPLTRGGGSGIIKEKKVTNANGKSVKIVEHTDLYAEPNSITQKVNAKGGVERNYYDNNGRQYKQIANNNHGNPEQHPYGKRGEHAHDYVYDESGNLIGRPMRELDEEERKENDDIL